MVPKASAFASFAMSAYSSILAQPFQKSNGQKIISIPRKKASFLDNFLTKLAGESYKEEN